MRRVKFSDLVKFSPRQQSAVEALEKARKKFLLYGGALGGGKSYFLRWYGVRRLMRLAAMGIKRPAAMLACEDYPSLKDRQIIRVEQEFPPWLGKLHNDHRAYGRSFILAPEFGSGAICFRNLNDPSKYQSAEFALILVDELTKNTIDVFTHLRHRLRWSGLDDIDCQFVGATNPGGVGHGWVKQLWMDKNFGPEWIEPIDYRDQFIYVPSKAADNPHLPPSYWAQLQTLPENLRRAFVDGDWNFFIGQAFPDFVPSVHVVPFSPPPDGAPLYSTFDWGFGAPFSWGWWWVDNDGRVIRMDEWYGWNGTANTGLHMSDTDIARGIVEREKALGIWGRGIIRLAGHDCFAKRPDYNGGGQGPSTAEVFSVHGIYLSKADSTRALKIRAFRERLRMGDKGPMLVVSDRCKQFIRTIPNLTMDTHNIEDVDTTGEDHVFDEAAQICMARPMAMVDPEKRKSDTDRRLERLERNPQDMYEMTALAEREATMRELEGREPTIW